MSAVRYVSKREMFVILLRIDNRFNRTYFEFIPHFRTFRQLFFSAVWFSLAITLWPRLGQDLCDTHGHFSAMRQKRPNLRSLHSRGPVSESFKRNERSIHHMCKEQERDHHPHPTPTPPHESMISVATSM